MEKPTLQDFENLKNELAYEQPLMKRLKRLYLKKNPSESNLLEIERIHKKTQTSPELHQLIYWNK